MSEKDYKRKAEQMFQKNMKVWLFPFIFSLFLTFTRGKEKDEKHLCDTCVRNNCSQRNYKYPSKMIKCSMYKE